MQTIFITGGTGYIGTRLIKSLLQRGGYCVRALVREESRHKLPPGCEAIIGNALESKTYWESVRPSTTFVHLVGVAHPSPFKKQYFQDIDLVSVQQAAMAAKKGAVEHFVYLSVAQYPTKIMKDYQSVRAAGESLLLESVMKCSFIRPWYVLGPGHWWPLLLKPFYRVARVIPALKEKAEKLDTVTIDQMIASLVHAIDHPPARHCRIYEVSDIQTKK